MRARINIQSFSSSIVSISQFCGNKLYEAGVIVVNYLGAGALSLHYRYLSRNHALRDTYSILSKLIDALSKKNSSLEDIGKLFNTLPIKYTPPPGTLPSGDIAQQINTKNQELLMALNAQRLSWAKMLKGPEGALQELIPLISELSRLYDIYRFPNYSGAPRYSCCIELDPEAESKKWKKVPSKEALKEVPPYLYYYSHPMDGDSNDNWRGFPSLGSKIYYASNSPWTKGIDFLDRCLKEEKKLRDMNVVSIKEFIKQLHQISIAGGSSKGSFRKENVVVVINGFNNLNLAIEYGKDSVQKALLIEIRNISNRWDEWEPQKMNYLTPEQWTAYEAAIGIAAPQWTYVDNFIDEFCAKLVVHLKDDRFHPFQVAAFIHCGITTIHPYEDGNGRLARLLMNYYLMENGFYPIVIPTDKEYTKVSLQSVKQREKVFSDYLNKIYQQIIEGISTGQSIVKTSGEPHKHHLPMEKNIGKNENSGSLLFDSRMNPKSPSSVMIYENGGRFELFANPEEQVSEKNDQLSTQSLVLSSTK